jgi:hypothetical protein
MDIISFRSNKEFKQELDFIKLTLNVSQSQAIKDAVHAFYQYLKDREEVEKSPYEIFKESGYLGSFSSRKDLSTTYKNDLIQDKVWAVFFNAETVE